MGCRWDFGPPGAGSGPKTPPHAQKTPFRRALRGVKSDPRGAKNRFFQKAPGGAQDGSGCRKWVVGGILGPPGPVPGPESHLTPKNPHFDFCPPTPSDFTPRSARRNGVFWAWGGVLGPEPAPGGPKSHLQPISGILSHPGPLPGLFGKIDFWPLGGRILPPRSARRNGVFLGVGWVFWPGIDLWGPKTAPTTHFRHPEPSWAPPAAFWKNRFFWSSGSNFRHLGGCHRWMPGVNRYPQTPYMRYISTYTVSMDPIY